MNEGYKNLEILIRLCAVLHPIGVVERLTIIGGGPRIGALREKVAALNLGDVVDLPGHLPESELGALLSTCHVGLVPSRNSMAEGGFEGFGLAVHEFAAAGLPVLVGAAGGATEAIHDPWARELDPEDLWSWVEVIDGLYANEDHRLAMGVAALTWAKSIDHLDSARSFSEALLQHGSGRHGGAK